jgi:ParB family chromosome partitioning protein
MIPTTSRGGGVFVVVAHDGDVRIERGFIRAEDEAPEPEPQEAETVIDGVRVNGDGEILDSEDGEGDDLPETEAEPEEDAGDAGKPLPDSLIRDLTAYRTLGLRLALGEQPDMALIAVVHTLAAQTYYRGGSTAHCLEISPSSNYLAAHADGIEDTAAAKMLADRHAGWAADMPRDVADLWGFVAGLDHASLMALLAHCASLTVNAVKLPWESSKRRAHETADKLVTAVTLDMTAHWTPTVRSYFGRVTKAHILAAVRDALGDEAAERIADKKKMEMAEAAEQLLAGTGWLPPVLRTARPAWLDQQADTFALDTVEPASSQKAHDDHFAIAAE